MLNPQIKKESAVTLRDYLEKIFRHKGKALLFLLAVMTAALVVLAFTPGTYTSTSKLLMRIGRENVSVDPTSAIGTMLPVYREWTSVINSELEILKSRELMEDVVGRLGLQAFFDAQEFEERGGKLSLIRQALNPARRWIADGLKRLRKTGAENEAVEVGRMNKALQMLEENLQIGVQEKSDIINVSYAATRPDFAQQVVTLLIDRYLERRIEVRKMPGAYQFFTEQKGQLLAALQQTEQAIRTIKEQAGISLLDDSRQTQQTALADMQTRQMNIQSALAASQARVDTIRATLAPQNQSGVLLDPGERKDLQAELRREETALAALLAENQEISRQTLALREQLAVLDSIDPSIRTLQREQVQLEEKYRKYSENQEQARINQALETEKISNVSIVQRATLPAEPDPSGKFFKLLAAVFIGLLGGVAIAFGSDYLDPTLNSAVDISGYLHLSTLIELPNFMKKDLASFTLPPETGSRRSKRNKAAAKFFQELCFKILALCPDEPAGPLMIGLTGSLSGEGVSTLSTHLAAAFSNDDRFGRVLLLDADPSRLPTARTEPSSESPFIRLCIQELSDPVAAGSGPAVSGTYIDALSRIKKQAYDIVIADLPPIGEGGYAVRASAVMDMVLIVAAAGRTPWRTVLRSIELLTDAKAALKGIILNRRRFAMPVWLYRKL